MRIRISMRRKMFRIVARFRVKSEGLWDSGIHFQLTCEFHIDKEVEDRHVHTLIMRQ